MVKNLMAYTAVKCKTDTRCSICGNPIPMGNRAYVTLYADGTCEYKCESCMEKHVGKFVDRLYDECIAAFKQGRSEKYIKSFIIANNCGMSDEAIADFVDKYKTALKLVEHGMPPMVALTIAHTFGFVTVVCANDSDDD